MILIVIFLLLLNGENIFGLHIHAGHHRILLPNVSLGLENHDELKHHCLNSQPRRGQVMGYTANRRLQNETMEDALRQKLETAFVLAVGGHRDNPKYNYGASGSINGLMSVWDTWVTNFFPSLSNNSALVLLFDRRDYLIQTFANSTSEYLDTILIRNMEASPVECLSTMHRAHLVNSNLVSIPKNCSNHLYLDDGYQVYYINMTSPDNSTARPMLIFAAVHRFPAPSWSQGMDEEALFKSFHPAGLAPNFPTNYAYIKFTNWYSYHLLNLRLLDFFDYAGKLDNDVIFPKTMPENNFPLVMVKQGSVLLYTQDVPLLDNWQVAQGVRQALMNYTLAETARCSLPEKDSLLLAGGRNDPLLWEGDLKKTIKSHFIVFWLGIYTAPETVEMARYWNEYHPKGMWDYRWTDQQWFPRPISMFGRSDTKTELYHYDALDETMGQYVQHKTYWRYKTLSKSKYFDPINGSNSTSREAAYWAGLD